MRANPGSTRIKEVSHLPVQCRAASPVELAFYIAKEAEL